VCLYTRDIMDINVVQTDKSNQKDAHVVLYLTSADLSVNHVDRKSLQ
jgi:hypothetical protein